MYKIKFYKKAKEQYLQICEFIAQDNLFYANEVLNKIDSSIETILMFPFIWVELWKGIRKIVEPNYKYKIVYKISWDIIYIVSVFKYKNLWE